MISMDKKYQYRNGEPARVLCVDCIKDYPVISMDIFGQLHKHSETGEWHALINSKSHRYDLIEANRAM